MSYFKKLTFLKVLTTIAWADGEVTQSELNILKSFYRKFDLDKDELATIKTPNPSKMVEGYEGTASVSEAAAIKSSGGNLIVEKQKFPPDLTIAIARINE